MNHSVFSKTAIENNDKNRNNLVSIVHQNGYWSEERTKSDEKTSLSKVFNSWLR